MKANISSGFIGNRFSCACFSKWQEDISCFILEERGYLLLPEVHGGDHIRPMILLSLNTGLCISSY
ncbi:MAG: hypothetical protein KAS93_07295 [Gammaproteobacteria bacterium]|nr:hypothetical protein [Gammaproteobacteria bacterium]